MAEEAEWLAICTLVIQMETASLMSRGRLATESESLENASICPQIWDMSDELCPRNWDISALTSARYAAISPAQRMIPPTEPGRVLGHGGADIHNLGCLRALSCFVCRPHCWGVALQTRGG